MIKIVRLFDSIIPTGKKRNERQGEREKTIYVNIEYHTPIITPKPVQITDEQLFDEEWNKK